MGSKDIGSKELFTQSLYAQSAPVGPKSKENMSMAPKSLPATSAPNANSSFPRFKLSDDLENCIQFSVFQVRNVVIKRVSNMFYCEQTRPFDSITELITYYTKHTGACTSATFQLKNPILLQPWEFHHSDVTVGKVLGEGAFGKVCSGTLKLKDGSVVEVAIKMTKVSAFLSKLKIREMMNEARFIRNFNHKNVVRLYGVAHDEQPLYILLELVKGGSLQDHMKKAKANGTTVTIAERIKDIAARNCLLHEDVVKITDFGLSRTGPCYKLRTTCKLPVKWLAPETLSTLTFTYATDVYSWGITCYEVFADGAEPFESISNAVVKADVLSSKFLQMPSNTPEAIKKYLNHFIFVEAARRASMSMAVGEFDRMAVMSENGTLEGGGAKQKLLKVFKKRHEKQSKGE
ncbi:Protein CBG20434 [Caenorhabditis briggsae]|uniref:non-specific protein-tyrosine kinase n=1 Tax=Caenorhabditis briggsae TaxID=6238 RepID=A8XXS8_CAEBR|nr:Protein CBG20434 [Caenorhabditis briggsae]CAP37447.1 Protein CBG20434 [Caenorhabditis briggsae]